MWCRNGFRLLLSALVALAWAVAARGQEVLGDDLPLSCVQPVREEPKQRNVVIESVDFEDGDPLPIEAREKITDALKNADFSSKSRWVNEAETKVRFILESFGFYEVQPDVHARFLESHGEEKTFSLEINAGAAERFRFSGMQFGYPGAGGDPLFSQGQLRKFFNLKDGDFLNLEEVQQGVNAIRTAYSSQGYVSGTAIPTFRVDHGSHTIEIDFWMVQRPQMRVNEVKVLGLGRDLEDAVRQRISPGGIFDEAGFKALLSEVYESNKDRLPSIGDASPLKYEWDPKIEGSVDVTIDFRECQEGSSVTRDASAGNEHPDAIDTSELGASLVKAVYPQHPPQVMKSDVLGGVKLRVRVERDGSVSEVKVLSGPEELAPATADAVRKWEFDPPASAPAVGIVTVWRTAIW